VPLTARTGVAFRWRPTLLSGEASDFVRLVDHDGVQLAVLANGFECGFSTCWPPASRLILERFVEAWSTTSGPVRGRLEAAFDGARRRFIAQARALVTPASDFPDDPPSAVLLAVAIAGPRVHVVWIGGDLAVLARGAHPIAATTPHTLLELARREHPEVSDLSKVPDVLVRAIIERSADEAPPDYLAVTAEPGDTLLLLSRAALRGPCVPIEEAARVASEHASPAVVAERLAETAFAATDAPYAVVVALRFDGEGR